MLLENDAGLAKSLEATRQRLGGSMVRIERADALAWMARCAPGRFELVLLDPPFDTDLASPAAAAAASLVCEGGFVYLESGGPLPEPPPNKLSGTRADHKSETRGARVPRIQHRDGDCACARAASWRAA